MIIVGLYPTDAGSSITRQCDNQSLQSIDALNAPDGVIIAKYVRFASSLAEYIAIRKNDCQKIQLKTLIP